MTRHALFVPPFDALASPRLLAELAAEAEQAGWDGFFLWDHMTYTPPVQAILDPWICMAAMAAATERVVLGAMVTPLPRRRPAVLARQAVTLDLLAQGRLVLGFGIGDDGSAREMSGFGEEPDSKVRAAMLDEGLDLLGELLAGGMVDHHGEHYTAGPVRMLPTPTSRIPIWIAGRWPNRPPLRRAVRYDGAFVIAVHSADEVRDLVATLTELRGDLDGYDVVLELPGDDAAAEWSAIPGVSWLLTRMGPYDLDADAVRRRVLAGPPPSGGRAG